MKRGGPLRRKTALSRSSSIPRASSEPKRKPVDPDDRVAEREAKRVVRERSGGVCEGCGEARASNFAHRKRQGQGGPWCPSNGLDLCGSGSTGCHGWSHENVTAAEELGWMLRSRQDPESEPAVLAGRGRVYLFPDGSVSSHPPQRKAA